jgi:hypothetical protein
MEMHTLLALARTVMKWTKNPDLEVIIATTEYSYHRWGDTSDASALVTAIHAALIFDRYNRPATAVTLF